MDRYDPKATLHEYLRSGREALMWKCDGLSEYDVRRPLVRTGTNLLGLVKHLASVELGYFGETFGRPSGIELPWFADDAEPNADLWATPDESREEVLGLYRRAWEHADETIGTLDVEARGRVPWWPEGRDEVTLHQILVHMATETHRHAGQADIVRELIDGSVGLRPGRENIWAGEDEGYWDAHRERLEAAAREAANRSGD
ncbi:MAG TPA: DinB family protein [Nocardioidaceae bacterium]|nr:DinB family protein [Nocardioidaceae bacterium]